MKEKISEKIIKNYPTLVNKLEDYSNSKKDKEEENLRDLASFLSDIVDNTDFEENIINNDLTKYYGKDKSLMNILNERKHNILQSALKEPKTEILKVRLAQLSNELYHHIEKENIISDIDFKNVKINKLSVKFQIFLKDQKINLNEIEKEFSTYNHKYINKKIMGTEMKKFIDFMSANGIKKEEKELGYYKAILNFFEKNEIIKDLKEFKEDMTSKILKYPQNVRIFKENDNQPIDNEQSYRLYIVEKNGYLYTQFHTKKSLIDNMNKKYKEYIANNTKFDKKISPSIGVTLNEDERITYEKNKRDKEDVEHKDYIFYYDNFIKNNEKEEIENEK